MLTEEACDKVDQLRRETHLTGSELVERLIWQAHVVSRPEIALATRSARPVEVEEVHAAG